MELCDYTTIWDTMIFPHCLQLQEKYDGLAFDADHSKTEIHQYYIENRDYCKRHYMSPHDDIQELRLNRYKVAASAMIAILKTKPLKKADMRYYKESPDKWIFNEALALYTGLMIVRCFMLADADGLAETNPRRKIIEAAFKESLPLNKKARDRWEIELYYLRQEGCYNTLALAHELEAFSQIAILRQAINMKETLDINSLLDS